MTCIRIPDGYLCVRNEPVRIEHGGRVYQFEWTEACGWIPVNKDGDERRSPVPKGAWDKLLGAQRGEDMTWGIRVPQEEREKMFRLHRGGHSYAEIAKKLKRPLSTVEKNVKRERVRRRESTPCTVCGQPGDSPGEGQIGHPTQWVSGKPYCIVHAAFAELERNGRGQ